MTATNHGLFGAVLAIAFQQNPGIAIAAAPLSHFILDAIPHFGDSRMNLNGKKFLKILIFDCTLAVVSTLAIAWFWQEIALLVICCAFLAASPDLMWIYYEYINKPLKSKHRIPRFHSWVQWSQTPRGAYIEVLWFLILFPALLVAGI